MNRTEVARYLATLTDDEFDQLTDDARRVTQYLTTADTAQENNTQPEPIRNGGNDQSYPASWGYHPEGIH